MKDTMKDTKRMSNYEPRKGNLREKIRQEEVEKLQKEAKQFMDARWEL